MSRRHDAWSGRLANNSALRCKGGLAFTLTEMLVVVALVAVLTALVAPSLQGLFGVVGRRGGANTLSAALDQARLAAVENGVPAFVLFPTGTGISNDLAWSSVIVMRALRDGEAGAGPVPLTRWLRLPDGVYVEPTSLSSAVNLTTNLSGVLPKLKNISVSGGRGFSFDRFGRLSGAAATAAPPELRVGEGVVTGDSLTFRPSAEDYYALSIQPLTGRVKVTDAKLAK
jgi:prepilin-type N-terminal cleavage/methylation domain-containing protein